MPLQDIQTLVTSLAEVHPLGSDLAELLILVKLELCLLPIRYLQASLSLCKNLSAFVHGLSKAACKLRDG